MATKKRKDIKYYLSLPWSYTITTTMEEGAPLYIIRVNELPGVCTDAPTAEEAIKNIKEAMECIFELYLEKGEEIPEPADQEAYKGKIAYRTSSKRHSLIAREALARQTSLSSIIDECIDRTLK
jgi:antitoxin HicB